MALGDNVSCVCPRVWGAANMSVMGSVWVGWVPSLSRQQTLEGRRGDLPELAMSGGSLHPAVLGGLSARPVDPGPLRLELE